MNKEIIYDIEKDLVNIYTLAQTIAVKQRKLCNIKDNVTNYLVKKVLPLAYRICKPISSKIILNSKNPPFVCLIPSKGYNQSFQIAYQNTVTSLCQKYFDHYGQLIHPLHDIEKIHDLVAIILKSDYIVNYIENHQKKEYLKNKKILQCFRGLATTEAKILHNKLISICNVLTLLDGDVKEKPWDINSPLHTKNNMIYPQNHWFQNNIIIGTAFGEYNVDDSFYFYIYPEGYNSQTKPYLLEIKFKSYIENIPFYTRTILALKYYDEIIKILTARINTLDNLLQDTEEAFKKYQLSISWLTVNIETGRYK